MKCVIVFGVEDVVVDVVFGVMLLDFHVKLVGFHVKHVVLLLIIGRKYKFYMVHYIRLNKLIKQLNKLVK